MQLKRCVLRGFDTGADFPRNLHSATVAMKRPAQQPPEPTAKSSAGGDIAFSPARRRMFRLLAVLAPFILLFAIEGVLRLCGFGGHPSVIKVVGPYRDGQLATTYIPGATTYFDTSKSTPGSIGQYAFLHPKPSNTTRILLAGASAIQGYPQPLAFANSAFLREMLADVWPQRSVEVINLGTTAVATFPVLDMLTQALAYQPDLVVIYAGHNEFFGAYGVASLQSGGDSPGAIRFHHWSSGLGITQGWRRLTAGRGAQSSGALMEVMVGRAYVGPDDPLRQAAARNVGAHVRAMIEGCQAQAVPVIVCALASNERDLAPVGAFAPPDLAASTRSQLEQLHALARAHRGHDQAEAARDKLAEAAKLAPQHAHTHYALGEVHLALGDPVTAAGHFHQALDFDPMPWRAPAATNAAIRSAATEQGAIFCDVQQRFRDASSNGIIGWPLMDDHVHFSLRGQALLARCIVEAMTGCPAPVAVSTNAIATIPDWRALADRLGANEYERYAVAHGMRSVFSVPFMRESNPQGYARWDELCKRLLRGWPLSLQQVAQEWQDPQQHRIVRRPLGGFIGRALIRQQRYAEAEPLLYASARCVPEFSTWNIEYTYFALVCHHKLNGGRLDESALAAAASAFARTDFMLAHGTGNPGLLRRFRGRLHQLRGDWEKSIDDLLAARTQLWEMEKVACDAALIEAYVRIGQSDRARALADEGMAKSGAFADHYRRFRQAIPPP
jgi:tetratricopeptide (TPR) repeat protein